MTDTDTVVTIIGALAIVIGIFGTFIPFVPGLILSWVGVLVWAIFHDGGSTKWVVFVIATVLALLGTVLKYLVPGRNMKRDGVRTSTLLAGGALAIVGFFVVPIIGLFLGFVLGVFLTELARQQSPSQAWPATWKAVKAIGVSVFIEVFAGLLILLTFIIGVILV